MGIALAPVRRFARRYVLAPTVSTARRVLGGDAPPRVRRAFALPGHEVFAGYYTVAPVSPDGTRVLALAVPSPARAKAAGQAARLGWFPREGGGFEAVGETVLWCWQVGACLAWLDDDTLGANAMIDGEPCYAAFRRGRPPERIGARALFCLDAAGRCGVSVNFGRLAWARPGYGYPDLPDPAGDRAFAADDGLFVVPLDGREPVRAATMAALVEAVGTRDAPGFQYLNLPLISPGGSAFVVLHKRIPSADATMGWRVEAVVGAADGADLHRIALGGKPSHYAWLDERRLLVTVNRGPTPWQCRYLVYDRVERTCTPAAMDTPRVDGHPGLHPGTGRWVSDSYPDLGGLQALWTIEPGGQRRLLGRFGVAPGLSGELKCDLHPRWAPEGASVLVDSTHEDHRALYEIEAAP